MARTFKNLFGLIKEKTVPPIDMITETTREGLPKAYIPKFLYKPPFGYPRFVDLPNIRRLAAMPYVDMCITAIVDELCSVPWDIGVKEGIEETEEHAKQIKHVKEFYENPNTNKESFDEIRRKYIRDILEIDAGVINKIFNLKGEMVEIVARDGATFTKNPDIFGMMTNREDIIKESNIAQTNKESRLMEPGWISAADAREKAAYFQYGWITGARPVPFGKREIVWFERNPRTDSIYGRSPVEILASTIQTLIYSIEHNLEYFNDNSIPKGIIGLDGSDTEEIKAFKEQWVEQQQKKDSAGNWKKIFHHVPIVNKMPKFERIQFTNAELELLEGQKWWAKMVWACFGVTAVELGYTEDAKGLANQIVQSNVFRKRAINPILRLEEYKHNHEILSEFGYPDLEFKFLMFDVEEETKKANLYKIQLDAGYRTVNEIRQKEGLEDIEGGDDLRKKRDDFFEGNFFEQEQSRMEEESEEEFRPEQKAELKYKYIKRTGSPGHYRYWYRDPKTGKLVSGKKPKEKKEFFGPCDKVRKTKEGEKFWQEMMKKKKEISKKEFLENVDVSKILDEGETFSDYVRDNPDIEFYKSKVNNKDVYFFQTAGFEFIFKSNSEFKSVETKPGMGRSKKWWDMYHALRKQGYSKESAARITNSRIKEKALQTENPLILRENERIDADRLKRSIIYLIRQNEKKIKELIAKEAGKNKLQEIKSVDDIAKAIKNLITFQGLKTISDAVIKHTFMKGWESAEKQLDRNFMVNKQAISYIQDYTFNNIKDMTEEIVNDLRAELERGIMAGEGVEKLKARVGKVLDVGENRAEMIARTETNRAENQGKLQAFKSSGERYQKRWVTHFDNRTSAICKRLDGQVVNMDENFKDKITGWEGPCPPAHVDCRSTIVFTLKETEKKAMIKALEEEMRAKEDKEQKILDEELDLQIKKKELAIKKRKERLIKELQENLDEGNKNIS